LRRWLPDGATLAPAILPGAQVVFSYHVVIQGSDWGWLRDGVPVRLEAGDVLVFPYGDPYVLSIARGMRGGPALTEILAFFRQMAAGQLPFTVGEGGRAFKKIVGTAPATWRRRGTGALHQAPRAMLERDWR
jgi:Cupin